MELFHVIFERFGAWLVLRGITLMPVDSTLRAGLIRGAMEQREYDRYEGYTRLVGEKPYPFDRWREIHSTLQIKFASAR